MSIKVLVNGAFGRMGQLTAKAIQMHPNLELVGQTSREYDLQKSIRDSGAQVVVDFTHPEVVLANTETIIRSGARPVIGTSGLTPEHIPALEKLCEQFKVGGLIAPNFSIGAVLMMKYAGHIAQYMPNVEIIEMHHERKADSPSGTAIRTADILAQAVEGLSELGIERSTPPSQETLKGARGANYRGIPIHAVRLPGLLAHQQVIFGEAGETLTLRHDSIDRQCFMPGICLACEKVMELDHLVYGLEEIL